MAGRNFKFLSVLLLLGCYVVPAVSALAITPDEVKQAERLINEQDTIKSQIDHLKNPDALASLIVYEPNEKNKGCLTLFSLEGNISINGKQYCTVKWTNPQKIPLSIIADMQVQFDEIESKLCKLGVHEKKKEENKEEKK